MAEKEYIEKETVLKHFDEVMNNEFCDADFKKAALGFSIYVSRLAAADVEPVRHGKWIYNPNGMDFNLGAWECSACAQRNNSLPCNRNISPYICVGSKYCPNCGARMCGEIK